MAFSTDTRANSLSLYWHEKTRTGRERAPFRKTTPCTLKENIRVNEMELDSRLSLSGRASTRISLSSW